MPTVCPSVKRGNCIAVEIVSSMNGDLLEQPTREIVEASSDSYVLGNQLSVDFWRHDIEHVAEWDLDREEWVECMP